MPLLLNHLTRRQALFVGTACALSARGAVARASRTEGVPALLLAREAAPDQDPAGYLVSEKFDGVRALWDGQRLRFRGGGAVAAPATFVAGLPAGQALDGELWLGRSRFDALSAIVRREQPSGVDWAGVRYLVFEQPGGAGIFAERVARLKQLAADTQARCWSVVEQSSVEGPAALRARLAQVVVGGGEGLVLHRADAPYRTGRSELMLKFKPVRDAEATVIGHTPGRGQFAGQLGALRVRDDEGREFLVGSGLSEAQRASPPSVGSVVTYSWRGETASGLPRFPTLVRLREAGW